MRFIFTIQMLVIPVLSLAYLVFTSGCSKEQIVYDNELMTWVKTGKRTSSKKDDLITIIKEDRDTLRTTMKTWKQ